MDLIFYLGIKEKGREDQGDLSDGVDVRIRNVNEVRKPGLKVSREEKVR